MRKTVGCMYVDERAMKWLVCVFVCILMVGIATPLQAEIYKWQDENGVTYYSNKPPVYQTQTLETVPTKNAPVKKESEGHLYSVQTPAEQKDKTLETWQITLAPEQVREMLLESVQSMAQTEPQTSQDMTVLTLRLAEVESALQAEVENRLRWQHEYAQAQSAMKDLQGQNGMLKLALTRMEEDIEHLRGAVIASDVQLATLKYPPQQQQLAMLEGKMEGIQTHVGILSQEVAKLDDLALSEKFALLSAEIRKLETQQKPDLQVYSRLASLETGVQQLFNALPASQETTKTLQAVAEDGNTLRMLADYQALQLDKQQYQIETLRTEVARLHSERTASAEIMSTQTTEVNALFADMVEKNMLLESVIQQQASVLKVQNEQIKGIEVKLAQLQEPKASLEQMMAPVLRTGGGIKVVPRTERRRSSYFVRMANWFKEWNEEQAKRLE